MTDSFVLDASALLCLLNGETGASRVAEVLPRSVVSAVNLSEVASKLADAGGRQHPVDLALRALHLKVVAFDEAQALIAGQLRPATRQAGLSLGDRACLALAKQRAATALTADRAWAALSSDLGVRMEMIR